MFCAFFDFKNYIENTIAIFTDPSLNILRQTLNGQEQGMERRVCINLSQSQFKMIT